MTLHEIIDRCQGIIMNLCNNMDSYESTLLLAKNRVDETNMVELCNTAHRYMNKEDLIIFDKSLDFMKKALADICEEYGSWALEIGHIYSSIYSIPYIDSNSLALEGLYKAAIRYVPGGSFKSYAISWIRQSIQRYVDQHLSLSLDSPMKQGEVTTNIQQLEAKDCLWGQSTYFAKDPFVLEELRLKYCPHLSMNEMKDLITDDNIAYAYGY